MKDMKPVAWIVSDGGSQFITTKEDELKNAIRFNWTVTPLYAIPEGCVVVPVEPTEGMRSAYLDASIAPISTLSIAGYKAMIKAAQEEG